MKKTWKKEPNLVPKTLKSLSKWRSKKRCEKWPGKGDPGNHAGVPAEAGGLARHWRGEPLGSHPHNVMLRGKVRKNVIERIQNYQNPKKIWFSDVLGPTCNENHTRRQKEWDQEDNTKHSMNKYVQWDVGKPCYHNQMKVWFGRILANVNENDTRRPHLSHPVQGWPSRVSFGAPWRRVG